MHTICEFTIILICGHAFNFFSQLDEYEVAISSETENLVNKALEAWNIEPVQRVCIS